MNVLDAVEKLTTKGVKLTLDFEKQTIWLMAGAIMLAVVIGHIIAGLALKSATRTA